MSVTRGTARAARAARIGRRGFLTSSAVFVSGVWTGAARADAVDDVLRDVGAARAKVRTLIAPFRQERVLSRTERLELQQLLAQRGFYKGTPDGQFGGQTREALRAFQAQSGLPADGFATADVLDRLRGR